jgi:uncharacterized protein (DUF1697 family)
VPTHIALLRGVNVGGKKVAMAQLREVVAALGHAEVATYLQSGNVLFTPWRAGVAAARNADSGQGGTGDAELAAGVERAIADAMGVPARVVVLCRAELARAVRDNPYPGRANPSCGMRCPARDGRT